MSDAKDVILYCGNGHKKTMSESNWASWKAEHGPGSVMMCRKCDDKGILLPMSDIPRPFLDDILNKAARLEDTGAVEGN
jgi:hypothetical protein